MPILDFDKLTPDNQAVKDLKDLIRSSRLRMRP